MPKNNESIGISAEVAIAKEFNLYIDPDYEARADKEIVEFLLKSNIKRIFDIENIPYPIEHVAAGQNPIDFMLENNKTLSVKTNQKKLGKTAPQIIGQPTSSTYFEYIETNKIIPNFKLNEMLKSHNLSNTYTNRAKIFKWLSIEYIDILINMYWEHLFECDYFLSIFNIEKFDNPINNYKVFGKLKNSPNWDKNNFSFTQSLKTWNESNTVKYSNVSIGEFQVHTGRDCFKFRFNMTGLLQIIEENLI